MEQLLRTLMLLSGVRRYSVAEICERFNKSERTVYRYLETIEKAGFIIEKDNRGDGMRYKLARNSHSKDLKSLLHFSDEEATLLYRLLSEIEGRTQLKDQLIKKLNSLYDVKAINSKFKEFEIERVRKLNTAITDEKQIILRNYRSSHSGVTADRIVEPIDFTRDYESVWCFDTADNKIKLFRISRTEMIYITDRNWQYRDYHKIPYRDAFGMSSDNHIAEVQADLTLKAYNLIREEFPLSIKFIKKNNNAYSLSIPVANYIGIGRFILGLPGEVKVHGPQEFKEFLKKEKKKHVD